MVYNPESLATFLAWVVNFLYVVGYVPQILLNYRNKSSSGLSDWMLIGLAVGYPVELFYIYNQGLPAGYKFFVPLGFVAVLVMVVQRFYYSSSSTKMLVTRWGSAFIAFIMIFLFVSRSISSFGYIAGWIATGIWTLYQVPQVFKLYFAKSTRGFSLSFISIMALGVTLECFAVLILQLPAPSWFSVSREVIVYSTFFVEFFVYGNQP
jgi:uncharacterized protein with PQ loop repeat